ncbi:FkbM family methyltransferase [Novosphingobium beihaiensis]|uniref:FkbM family methyltransferase n=1 Tax=Novosphingobium beihaiensis TaxID=2930389 RepID=A0ABT0BQX7_9SPHN|nr:FkbM family methyltransferase [Novosphingobium beihaiensis]MCJ2187468.1 FkbM family methyltransferase [Novosphingobium beihaiensis]
MTILFNSEKLCWFHFSEHLMDYAGGWALRARRIGQNIGILRPMVRFYRKMLNVDYEQAFDRGVTQRIRPGDTIWDVGANIGHYCAAFSRATGPGGKVIAIEPSPSSLQKLNECARNFTNVAVENLGLADTEGQTAFYISKSGNTVVEGLSRKSVNDDAEEISVMVMKGDRLAKKYPPNLIKIDVEGFELEVLEGLTETLKHPALHTVAIEVHFMTLASRGREEAPTAIRDILVENGFVCRWTDPSHVVASRTFA